MDLFETLDAASRRERLQLAFNGWIAHRQRASPSASRAARPLREDSAAVYRDMWSVFSSWCQAHDCDLETIDASALEGFLGSLGDTREATLRYRVRMLQLISRVDRFVARSSERKPNLAIADLSQREPYRYGDARAEMALPEFLTAGQTRALISFVTEKRRSPSADEGWSWKTVRDRTAVAVQLGSGITPGEARRLTLDQVIVAGGPVKEEPWALALPGNGNYPARQTPLARWAARQLVEWLRVRTEQRIPGEMVFPSTATGKVWNKDASHHSFRQVLEAAGVGSTSGGPFKLRHTFALRQLTRHSPQQVAQWLGLQDLTKMERYRRVLSQPVEVV